MTLDLLCVLVVVAFSLRGWWRGFVHSLSGLIGLFVGYLLAYKYCRLLGRLIAERAPGVPVPLLIALAGFVILIVISAVASLVGMIITRRRLAELEGSEREEMIAKDRSNGVTLGAVQGLLFACIVCLVLSFIPAGHEADRQLGIHDSLLVSLVKPIAPEVFGVITEQATGSASGARIVKSFVTNPAAAQDAVQKVMTSSAVQNLATDNDFIAQVAAGDADKVARDPRLQRVLADKEVIAALQQLGMSEQDLQFKPEEAAEAIRQVRVMTDEIQTLALQAIESGQLPPGMDTPQMRQAIEQGHIQEVLRRPGALRELLANLGASQTMGNR